MALDAGSVAVRVGADFSGQGFERYDRAVEKARGMAAKAVRVTLGAEADEGGFDRWDRSVAAARAKSHRPIEQKLKIDIDAASFAKAFAAQATLTKESSKLTDVFNRSKLSIGQWMVALGAGLPVIIDLGAALGALTASLGAAVAGLGALAAGAASAATVGFGGIVAIAAPAISQLTDLMTAQEAANKAQTTGAAGAARASAASAQQIASAREQVTTATRGVTTAEQQLESAQESAEIAQESLTQAREDAERQLQDMRRAAMGADEGEESARIALLRAEQDLSRVRRDAASGALDVREAENEVALARDNLRDVTIQGNRALEDYRDAQRDGITEMPGVIAAQQSYDAAVQGVQTAEDGVEQAHRDVTKALQNLTYQQKQANMATGAGGTALAALALAQQKAGPAAVRFARQIKDIGDRWRGLTRAGREDFFGGMSDGLSRVNQKLPMFARSANQSMRALRGGFDAFLDRATGPEFNRFIHTMTHTFARSIEPISRGFGNIAKVLQRIAVAVAPDVVRMAHGFEEMTEGWADSTKNAGKLSDTVHELVGHTQAWWDLLVAAKDLVVAALVPGMDEGKKAIEGMTGQLREWTDWINAHPKETREFFKEGMETTKQLAQLLLGFVPQLVEISKATRPIARAILGITQGLNSIKIGNVSALTGLIGAFLAFKGAKGLESFFGKIGGWSDKLKGLGKEGSEGWVSNFVGGIRAKGGRIRDAIGNALSRARTFVVSAATGAAEFVGSMVANIRSSRLANRLRTIFRAVAIQMGKVMAATIAGAVIIGEGIGGAAASLTGLLRDRLPGRMRGIGRIAGRAFGIAFVAGFVLALPELAKRLKEAITGDSDLGGALWKGSPFSIDLPGPWGSKGGLVTPKGIQYLQRGGMARGTDTVPAMLTPGEVVVDQPTVRRQGGPARLLSALRGGAMGGLGGFGHEAEGEGRRGSEGFVKALTDGARKAKVVATKLRKDTLDEFGLLRKRSGEDTEKMRKRTVDDFDTSRDKAVDSSKDLRKQVGDSYGDLQRDHDDTLRKMQRNVRSRFGEMADTAQRDSRKLSGSVHGSMREVSGVVFKGMSYIVRATNKALRVFDEKPINLSLDAPHLRQRGGHLPGGRTGDHNVLLAEDDEYVLNRNVTKGMGKEYLDWLNFNVFPRQRGGSIGGKGGMTAMVGEANKFERRHFPYAWGGGHGGFGIQPVDCSGAVSQVLHAAGLLKAPMVSGDLARWGKPGKGPLTVYANPEHTFMSLNGRYFGTSSSNPGGGAGWIEGGFDRSYLGQFAARTMDVAGAVAAKVKRLFVKGTHGPMHDVAQAALDKSRAAANGFIDDKMPGGRFGGGQTLADFSKGPGKIVGASVYGFGEPGTGTVGASGVSLPGKPAFAELGMGTALGHLPFGKRIGIEVGGKRAVGTKLDIGLGGGSVGGHPRAIDFWRDLAQQLGLSGSFLGLAKVRGLQRGGHVGRGLGPHRLTAGDWRHSFGAVPERFEDLFEAVGAGNQGAAGRAEAGLGNLSVDRAHRAEARMIRNLEQQMRQTQRRARRQLGPRWLRRHDIWGGQLAVEQRLRPEGRAARVLGQMQGRMRGLRRQSAGWEGRTDRRVEQMLRGGFGQLSQFQDARSELFGTFGSNFEGPGGPGAAFGPRHFGASGAAVAGPLEASGGAFGGSRVINGDIHLNNYFRETPREPHIWARGTLFELRAAT